MKTCFKCLETKPRSEFYRHDKMADGLLGKCKECTRADARANREAKIEYYREYDRQRSDDPKRVAARLSYQVPPERKVEYMARYTERFPEKYRARNIAHAAIRDGKLKPKPCERCGFALGKIHAHHEDYSKPLEVTWLCQRCHGQRHREINAERREAVV